MNAEPNIITIGSHVEIALVNKKGKKEHLALDLVPDRDADFDAGRLGESTPLARALVGAAAGATVPYHVGDLTSVEILSVGTARPPSADASAEREEKLRQARSQAELGNMIAFALTFDSKWGDYDPEEIAARWDENKPTDDEEKGKTSG